MISRFMTGKRYKVGRPCESDPQRHLLYRMERTIAGWAIYAHVEEDDLQMIADYVCRRYKVKRCSVVIENKGKDRIFGWTSAQAVHLNQDFHGDNTAVLAHELAHYVCDRLFPDLTEAHGAHFVMIYGEILDMLNLFPWNQWCALCDEWGVIYDPAEDGS